jgi:LacI family transcriptional regulator
MVQSKRTSQPVDRVQRDGTHGQRGATINDIAKRANVSKSTVSRVLNSSAIVEDSKQEAVRQAIKELDYKPNVFAQGLASGRSMTLGILIQNIGSPFYDTIAQGAIAGVNGSGYTPLFVDGQWEHDREAAAIETLISRRVDGLLIVGGDIDATELQNYKQRLPVIVVARDVEELSGQCVAINNRQIGYLATKHLLDQRHKRIAFLHGNEGHPDAQERYAGYLQALAEARVKPAEELIYKGDFSGHSGLMAVNYLLDQGVCFSALVAANDMVAFGARLGLYRRGIRVPDDVSIIGCDDQAEAAFMTPPLTTIRQPSYEMGMAGARALLALLSSEECEIPQLEPVLQVRESVKRFNG